MKLSLNNAYPPFSPRHNHNPIQTPNLVHNLIRTNQSTGSHSKLTALQRNSTSSPGEVVEILKPTTKEALLLGALDGIITNATLAPAALAGTIGPFSSTAVAVGNLALLGPIQAALSAATSVIGAISLPTALAAVEGLALLQGFKTYRNVTRNTPARLHIKTQPFTKEYLSVLKDRLKKSHHTPNQLPDPSHIKSTSPPVICKQELSRAYDLAERLLAPGAGCAVAMQVAKTLVSPQTQNQLAQATPPSSLGISHLDEKLSKRLTQLVENHLSRYNTSSSPLPTVKVYVGDLDEGYPAFSTTGQIAVDKQIFHHLSPAAITFILGHELGHIVHQDSLDQTGITTLQDILSYNNSDRKDSRTSEEVTRQLRIELSKTKYRRRNEDEADRYAVDFCRKEGYTDQEILQAAYDLFKNRPGGIDHKPGDTRIAQISEYLRDTSPTRTQPIPA